MSGPNLMLRTSGLAVGLGTEPIMLGLQAKVLSTAWLEDPINGVLKTKNLVIRLHSPDGSAVGTSLAPFFKGEPGGITQAERDQLVWAVQDIVVAAAIAEAGPTATAAAQAVLQAEVDARQLADSIHTAAIEEVNVAQQTLGESIALQITTLGATIDENVAALQDEKVARATAEEAIALRIDQTVAITGSNTAAIESEALARTDADSALSSRIDVVVANVGTNLASILTEQQTRADADSALSTRMDVVEASTGDTAAAISSLETAQATAEAATAASIQSLTTQVNGHSASITTHQSSIDGLSAQYSVKIDNNGYVSGYGLSSTPVNGVPTSAFKILADKFTIQMPGYAGVQPFVIQNVNGTPQISIGASALGDGTVSNTKLDGYLHSGTKWWGDGQQGWAIYRGSDGSSWLDFVFGSSRLRMSSWGDCGIQFPNFSIDNSGNLYCRGDIQANSLTANSVTTTNLIGRSVSDMAYLGAVGDLWFTLSYDCLVMFGGAGGAAPGGGNVSLYNSGNGQIASLYCGSVWYDGSGNWGGYAATSASSVVALGPGSYYVRGTNAGGLFALWFKR